MRTCYSILRQQLDDYELFYDYDSMGRGFLLHGSRGEFVEQLHGHNLQSLEPCDDDDDREFLCGILGYVSQ